MLNDRIQQKVVYTVMEKEMNGRKEKKGIDRLSEPPNTNHAIQQFV